MDLQSFLITSALFALLGLGYRYLRRQRASGESSPEHFFGAMDDETLLHEPASRRRPGDGR